MPSDTVPLLNDTCQQIIDDTAVVLCISLGMFSMLDPTRCDVSPYSLPVLSFVRGRFVPKMVRHQNISLPVHIVAVDDSTPY